MSQRAAAGTALPVCAGQAGWPNSSSIPGKGKYIPFCFGVFSERPDLAFENGDNSPIDFLRRKEWEHV